MNELIPENCKILIVDDVYQNIQILGKFLKTKGYLLSFALNGKEALKQVEIESFDLILLDIMMPEISGYYVCEKLKSNDKTKDIPVIFISAKVDVESIVKGFQLGAVDYVTKPFRREELLARVHTHLALKYAQQELMELNATKNKFFSIIAHDLKNPFNVILNFSELLFTNYDSFEKKDKLELIKDIYDSGKNLFKLLENLLSWARIQTSSMEINQVTIHLKLLVNDTISLLSQQAKDKKIQLISNVDTSASVFADFNMISTVIRNLISNAIKYTDENGRITIQSKTIGNEEKISISDSGVGMSEEQIENIFKVDKKYSSPGTAGESGTGLGLIICKDFVERNKGKIFAESTLGRGSQFKFTLPLN